MLYFNQVTYSMCVSSAYLVVYIISRVCCFYLMTLSVAEIM